MGNMGYRQVFPCLFQVLRNLIETWGNHWEKKEVSDLFILAE